MVDPFEVLSEVTRTSVRHTSRSMQTDQKLSVTVQNFAGSGLPASCPCRMRRGLEGLEDTVVLLLHDTTVRSIKVKTSRSVDVSECT